jgi:hypothetical protein
VIPEATYANWDLDGEAALAHLRAPDGTLLELQSY